MSIKSNVPYEWTNAIPTGRKLVSDGNLRAVDAAKVLTPDRLPSPVTVQDEFLRLILLELQATNELLSALIAQGEPPVPPVDSGQVELREQASKRKRG